MRLGWRFWLLFAVALVVLVVTVLSSTAVGNPYGLLTPRYVAGGAILGLFLMAWNWAVGKKAVENASQSDRTRHDPRKEPWLDESFSVTDNAVQKYIDQGDPSGIAGLAQQHTRMGEAFGDITKQRPDAPRLFVHPAWLYAGRVLWVVLVLAGIVTIISGFGGTPDLMALAGMGYPLGLILYVNHWNHFGGPWWLRVGYAHVALGIIVFADTILGNGVPLVLMTLPWGLGWMFLAILSAVAWSQVLWDRIGHPAPKYAYTGKPGEEVDDAMTDARAEFLHRLVAAGFMFIVLLVLAGLPFMPTGAMTPVIAGYPVIAAAFLATKLLLMLGLIQGRRTAWRRMEADRRRRSDALMQALASTENHT